MLREEKVKILVVDDEPDARFLLTEALIEQDYEVRDAENVENAMDIFDEFLPFIVVTDIRMPGEDGISLLKKVKNKNNNCHVIVMTGHGDKQVAIDALKNGAMDFLDKPFEDEELIAAVSRASELVQAQKRLKKAEIQAAQAAKLASIGYLAAGMAHEINNPLQILAGTIDILDLQFNKEQDKEVSDLLGIQKNCTNRIKNIVKGMRTYAREEDGSSEVFDANPLILETVNMIKIVFAKEGVDLEAELVEGEVFIRGNQQYLQQSLLNLISNAGDATKKSTSRIVKVSSRVVDGQLKIDVEDNGSGMSKEIQKRMFDPFFTTKEVGSGTGMGMSITQNLVQLMKGSIVVDSEVGRGTIFTLEFAIEKGDAKKSQTSSHETPQLSGKLLIVDDEEYIRNILLKLIKPTGVSIDTAVDGEQAWEKVKTGDYDLVITDMNMPKLDGEELLKRAKNNESSAHVKFIKITGGLALTEDGEEETERDSLFFAKLEKPFSVEKIYALLEKALS